MFPTNQINRAMRSALGFSLAAFIIVTQMSCGGGTKENKEEQTAADTSSSSSYQPPAASATYDPTKIDPNALVMEKQLDALGNSMDVMSFSVQEIKVKAGTTVKIHFTNTAKDPALKHNFFIVKNGTMEQVATAALSAGADKNYVPDDKTNILFTSIYALNMFSKQ